MDISSNQMNFSVFENFRNNKAETKADIICSYCKSTDLEIYNNIVYVCVSCGTQQEYKIINDKIENEISNTGENGIFNNDEKKSRCNVVVNPAFPQSSFSTTLCNKKLSKIIQNSHLWNNSNNSENNLWHMFRDLERKIQDLNIPQAVIESTKKIIGLIKDNNFKSKRGKNREGLLIAALLYGIQIHNYTRITENDIIKVVNIKKKIIINEMDFIKTIILSNNLNICNTKENEEILKIKKPEDYIIAYIQLFNVSQDIIEKTIKLAKICQKPIIAMYINNIPNSLATGCIYYTLLNHTKIKLSKIHIKRILSEKATISENTIEKCYNNIYQNIDKIENEMKKELENNEISEEEN